MQKRVVLEDVEAHIGEYLHETMELGTEYVITENGRVVASLQPSQTDEGVNVPATDESVATPLQTSNGERAGVITKDELRARFAYIQKGSRLEGDSIRELREEGRRY